MTYARKETDMHDSLYLLACNYPLIQGSENKVSGINALAQILGMSPTTLRNKLSPDIDTHKVSLEEAAAIMEQCRRAGMTDWSAPLYALNWRLNHIALEAQDLHSVTEDCILRAGGEAMHRIGEVAGSINGALQDGRIDFREMEEIEKKGRWANKWLNAWLARCRAKFQKDSKRREVA